MNKRAKREMVRRRKAYERYMKRMASGKANNTQSTFGQVWHRLSKSVPAMISMGFIIMLILCAIFADYIAPYDYAEQNLLNKFVMPDAEHWLGTDNFGRDILSRLLFGGRISLLVSVMATTITVGLAFILGCTVGYFGGVYDTIIMRICDVFMAIPGLLLTIMVSISLGSDKLIYTAIAISVGGIPVLTRQLRASVLLIRDEQYIEAAKAFGESNFKIIWKHILPNTLAPVIVLISMRLGENIMAIAGLSFLGLGVQPPTPEWGNMLSSGQQYIRTYWPLITFPGVLIGLTMLSFNLFGDGLRDALDPRLKR